ncbi:radical SAM protein [Bacteroidia bacterium]|nr:radical SAM protein [Bacteroidia bacterium]
MATFLFQDVVFGPIHSRRLGASLGVNLLPNNSKWCNYNCIYCECGWNTPAPQPHTIPDLPTISAALEQRLRTLREEHKLPDAITFSGNGEPTLHAQFADIIAATIALRNQYAPQTKICVLTNATNIGKKNIGDALRKVDVTMLKLDAGNDEMLQTINQPQIKISVQELVKNMQDFGERLTIQTMFLQGKINGKIIDNSQENEVYNWLQHIKILRPHQVVLYSLDRATPADHLQKIPTQRLLEIAQQVQQLGIKAAVY